MACHVSVPAGCVQDDDAHVSPAAALCCIILSASHALMQSSNYIVCWCACFPQVAMFQREFDATTHSSKWVYLHYKQPHTHDVRTLTVLQRPDDDPVLISGANDGQLVMYPVPRFLKVRAASAPTQLHI